MEDNQKQHKYLDVLNKWLTWIMIFIIGLVVGIGAGVYLAEF